MEEWKEYNLGELVELKNGFAFKSSEFVLSGIPVIKIKNVKPNRIILDDLSYITEESAQNKKCFYLLPSDILITMTGNRKDGGSDSWVGKVALFNQKGRYLLNQRVSAIRVKRKDIVDFHFLAYLISSWDAQLYFVNHSNSSGGQANISPDVVYGYNIALPPLSTQKQIASILSSLDDKIEVNRRINENLEQLAQALFKSWFVDFEPFKDGEFVESELGMIPKGWRVGSLNEVAYINPPRTLKKGQNALYLDMKNMPTSGPFPSNWDFKEYTGGMKFQNQDTLMARITPCLENGKVAYINFLHKDEVAFGSTEYIVMTAKDGFIPELLYFLCRDDAFKGYATKNMNGSSGRQRVSGETIGNYIIAIPPKNVISSISDYYNVIMDYIRKNGVESRCLAELRDTLLPRLMSGELKVNEIENSL